MTLSDTVYEKLRADIVQGRFPPLQPLRLEQLKREYGVGFSPLREALNRLVAEGFLTFQNNRGFFCRPLTPSYIMDLYEARVAVECEATRLACTRAPDEDIAALADYLNRMEPEYESATDPEALLAMDESFHARLAQLSGNSELQRILNNLNGRIRYIRLIDLKRMRDRAGGKAPGDISAHRQIVEGIAARNTEAAVAAMRSHIEKRREEATEAVRIAFSQLYVPDE